MAHQVNVFISHSWSYSDDYETLAGWLCESGWNVNGVPLTFLDRSIPRDDPIHHARNKAELRTAIFQRIANSHVMVMPAGVYSTHSDWIQTEVEGAQFHRRPIVAVDKFGAERSSSIVQGAAAEIVGWQQK